MFAGQSRCPGSRNSTLLFKICTGGGTWGTLFLNAYFERKNIAPSVFLARMGVPANVPNVPAVDVTPCGISIWLGGRWPVQRPPNVPETAVTSPLALTKFSE